MSNKCWYFEFEGEFLKDSKVNSGKGVFSSCLVPKDNYNDAEEVFLISLEKKKIKLLDVIDCYLLSEDTMDFNNEENRFWIDWLEETLLLQDVVFEEMYLYPKNDVNEREKQKISN